MSGVQEETIKIIGALYENLTARRCLCDSFGRDTTKILCDLTLQNRDGILLKVSLLTDLFEARHCRWVQDAAKVLLEDAVFLDSMRNLLRNEDSLVSFCACKCLVAATANCVQYGQTGFLKDLIKSIKALISYQSISADEVNQVVYTLDIFKHSIQHTYQGDNNAADDKSKSDVCPCIGDEMHGTEASSESSHVVPVHYSVVLEDLPSLTGVFLHMTASWCEQELSEHQQTNAPSTTTWVKRQTINSSEFTKILMAFLELLYEMVKCALNSPGETEQMEEAALIFKKAADFLWIDNLPTFPMKKIVEIANIMMDHFLELPKSTTESKANQSLDIVLISNQVLTQIATGWLEKIVYRNMALGFGGASIKGNDSDGDFCSGDHPLLRQLVKLGMSAGIIVLHHTGSNTEAVDGVINCMSAISQYIAIKMGLTKDREMSSWLFDLFADQDDSLILIMMRALQLHKLLHKIIQIKNNSGTSNSQDLETKLFSKCHNLSSLSPHKIFVSFLETVTFDPNLLLDLLISNETCFLTYMVQYLHTVLSDWEGFCSINSTCKDMKRMNEMQEAKEEEVDEKEEREEGTRLEDVEIIKSSNTDETETQSDEADTTKSISYWQENAEKCLSTSTTFQETGERVSICIDVPTQINTGKQSHLVLCVEQSDETIDNGPECKRRKILPPDGEDSQADPKSILPETIQPHSHKASDDFESPVEMNKSLDEVMTVLIRLRLSVERMSDKGLFPYNVAPLLRLLERVEGKYERNE